MKRLIKFTEYGYFDSNGCDCCEPSYVSCFNSSDIPYSCHYVEDCYIAVITEKIDETMNNDGELYEMSLAELKAICKQWDIEVYIEYED